MKKHIPNALTLLNLFSGCIGIAACFNNRVTLVPLFIGIALVADFLDGFIARLLNVKSDLGAQLDSLADMVTFGVLPGVMLYRALGFSMEAMFFPYFPLRYFVFLYTVFACLRLAKFNLDARQTTKFIGLATPAAA